jgi:hypothetical protein
MMPALALQPKNVDLMEIEILIQKDVKIIVEIVYVKNLREKVVVLVKRIARNAIYLLVL